MRNLLSGSQITSCKFDSYYFPVWSRTGTYPRIKVELSNIKFYENPLSCFPVATCGQIEKQQTWDRSQDTVLSHFNTLLGTSQLEAHENSLLHSSQLFFISVQCSKAGVLNCGCSRCVEYSRMVSVTRSAGTLFIEY